MIMRQSCHPCCALHDHEWWPWGAMQCPGASEQYCPLIRLYTAASSQQPKRIHHMHAWRSLTCVGAHFRPVQHTPEMSPGEPDFSIQCVRSQNLRLRKSM